MTITPGQVSVGTDATLIVASNSNRIKVRIKNRSGYTIYLGGSGVTTSNGFPLRSGKTFTDTMFTGAWYGIAAQASTVSSWEES